MKPRTANTLRVIFDAALCGQLDKASAHKLHELDPEAVALVTLAMCRRLAEQDAELVRLESQGGHGKPSPSTPSGRVLVYAKPNAAERRRKPGTRNGHKGVRRERPVKIDERKTHRLACCPHCSGERQRCDRTRTRLIEAVPEVIESVVTEHTIHRDNCPKCKKLAAKSLSADAVA